MRNTPIVICNRDRLSTTEKLCDQLLLLGYENIYILDNASTYPDLIKWYESSCPAQVIYLSNLGHQALWHSGILNDLSEHEYIVYTDSDIELNIDSYKGFIEDMIQVAKDFNVDKVGLAIQIDDIPVNHLTNVVRDIERRYWQVQLPHPTQIVYRALVDTTFAVMKRTSQYNWNGLRVAGNLTCRHMPWYNNWDNLSEEEHYYTQHADRRIATFKQLLGIQ